MVKTIYLQHELIRTHRFIDGNGRTTRIDKKLDFDVQFLSTNIYKR
ncbi:hypothetical protein [Lutibacter sp.]